MLVCFWKPLTSSQLQVPVSSWTNSSQYPHSRVQGRVQNPMEKMAYQTTPQNQVNKVSNPSQHRNGQKAPTQTRQGSVQTSGRQLGQRIQASLSPDSALTTNSFEFRETKSPQESSKSNTALIGKGKSVEGNGRGSFSFGGAQVIGASGALASSHGDVNFPGMPTFLPVMQFGGQHPGGIGVPAVGMAFSGYVNNPGLPVLAGPAGALGASYNSPYLSVDGTYNSRPTGQVSSLAGASSVGRVGSSTNLIDQRVDLVQDMDKRSRLMNILKDQRSNGMAGKLALTLVFVETKRGADALEHWLCRNDYPATQFMVTKLF